MVLTSLAIAATVLLHTPPAPMSERTDEPTPTEAQPPSPLATLTPASRSAVLRRAPFVYELPDGSIWDGYYHHEFRRVLDLYDSTSTSRPSVPADCKAWGFTAQRRAPAGRDARPHPLWTSVQAQSNTASTPFIYIDSRSPTAYERKVAPHAEVRKQLAFNVYEITVREFPAGGSPDAVHLPRSFSFGSATLAVLVPPQMKLKPGDTIKAEFFLIPDKSIKLPPGVGPMGATPARFVFAKDLRVSPERYAAALLDGRAELIEWVWKRERTPMGDSYVWTRSVVPIEAEPPAETR